MREGEPKSEQQRQQEKIVAALNDFVRKHIVIPGSNIIIRREDAAEAGFHMVAGEIAFMDEELAEKLSENAIDASLN